MRQMRLGDRDAQLGGFVQFAQADIVQVAGQQPFAAFGAADQLDRRHPAQQVLHQAVGEDGFQLLDLVAV